MAYWKNAKIGRVTNTMAYWYDSAALAATRSPVIALFWCLIKFTTTTTTTSKINVILYRMCNYNNNNNGYF